MDTSHNFQLIWPLSTRGNGGLALPGHGTRGTAWVPVVDLCYRSLVAGDVAQCPALPGAASRQGAAQPPVRRPRPGSPSSEANLGGGGGGRKPGFGPLCAPGWWQGPQAPWVSPLPLCSKGVDFVRPRSPFSSNRRCLIASPTFPQCRPAKVSGWYFRVGVLHLCRPPGPPRATWVRQAPAVGPAWLGTQRSHSCPWVELNPHSPTGPGAPTLGGTDAEAQRHRRRRLAALLCGVSVLT